MINDKTIQLEVPADYQYLNVVGACVCAILQYENNNPQKDLLAHSVELAVHETCVNIIEHAYAGSIGRIKISMKVSQNPHQLEIKIQDNGAAFTPGKIVLPASDQDVPTRGYGLYLIHQLMDDVKYIPQAGNNTWQLVKKLSP